jgi:hypothetical protein
MAAYSIACYILQIKDSHNGNIMIDDEGQVSKIILIEDFVLKDDEDYLLSHPSIRTSTSISIPASLCWGGGEFQSAGT